MGLSRHETHVNHKNSSSSRAVRPEPGRPHLTLPSAVAFALCPFLCSYTKPRGRVPDYDAPVVVPASKSTIEEFCMRIHRSLLEQFKYALVWGTSVKRQTNTRVTSNIGWKHDRSQLAMELTILSSLCCACLSRRRSSALRQGAHARGRGRRADRQAHQLKALLSVSSCTVRCRCAFCSLASSHINCSASKLHLLSQCLRMVQQQH